MSIHTKYILRFKGLPFHKPLMLAGLLGLGLLLCLLWAMGVNPSGTSKWDQSIHDQVSASKQRTQVQHTLMAEPLEAFLPPDWSRNQLVPSLLLAAQRLAQTQVRGVILDARIPPQNPDIPYFQCFRQNPKDGRWEPQKSTQVVLPSLDSAQASKILMPLPLMNDCPAGTNLFACDTLTRGQSLSLYMSLMDSVWAYAKVRRADVALDPKLGGDGVVRMGHLSTQGILGEALQGVPHQAQAYPQCQDMGDGENACFMLRMNQPHLYDSSLLNVVLLANCDEKAAQAYLSKFDLQNKWVFVQPLPSTMESDIHLVPSYAPQNLDALSKKQNEWRSGTEILAASLETALAGDGPRVVFAGVWAYVFLMLCLAWGVVLGLRLHLVWALLVPVVYALCVYEFMLWTQELWYLPVVLPALALWAGVLLASGTLLVSGAREAELTARYIPKPVYSLILKHGGPSQLVHRKIHVVALMSDLRNFTTMTEKLGSAESVLNLLNLYYDEMSQLLLDEHLAWHEAFVGDLFCCYWPDVDHQAQHVQQNALRAAVAVAAWHQEFFGQLREGKRELPGVSRELLMEVGGILGAGLGLAWGEVIMGNLGQKIGLSKFGVIGEPLNLASRIEGLSKGFTGICFVTEDFVQSAQALSLPIRRLAWIRFKGMIEPKWMIAVHPTGTSLVEIQEWEMWARALEQGQVLSAPECFSKDSQTLCSWAAQGILDPGGFWNMTFK